MAKLINRKGQIAIFVIVAVLIVAVILSIFLFSRKPTVQRGDGIENPESFIDNCVKDAVEQTLDSMLPQGGFANPTDYVMYQSARITYLCKNVNFYEPCVNQYPRYVLKLEEELNAQVKDGVEQCFSELENQLEKRNYEVSGGPVAISSTWKEKIIELRIEREFSMVKGEAKREFSKFDTVILSPAYELAHITNEIIAQEARNCYFSNDGFMILYPDYDIRKDFASDGQTKIYSVADKETNKKMVFAVRGCVIPAGF